MRTKLKTDPIRGACNFDNIYFVQHNTFNFNFNININITIKIKPQLLFKYIILLHTIFNVYANLAIEQMKTIIKSNQ